MDSILRQHGLDPGFYKLTRPCRRGHDWNGTGYTVRRRTGGHCVLCENPGYAVLQPPETRDFDAMLREQGVDASVLKLGSLCKHKHEWRDTGRSLRYRSNNGCTGCLGIEDPGVMFTPDEERFWQNVEKQPGEDACWLWTRRLTDDGYGQFTVEGKTIPAHRYAHAIQNGGLDPADQVLHKCDIRNCVRGDHLYAGDHQQNMKDRNDRNRQNKGETVNTAKLTREIVLEARQRRANKERLMDLAAEYGVTPGSLSKAIKGKNWGWLS